MLSSKIGFLLPLCFLLLGGCTSVQPLYSTGGNNSSQQSGVTAQQMKSIDISVAGTSLFQQSLYNDLIFDLRGGAAQANPDYTLLVTATAPQAAIAIDSGLNRPSASIINATARFQLTPKGSEKPVFIGAAYTTVTYDRSSQRFANERAQRDAEKRAAGALSDDIAQRLAVYFATQVAPAG